MCLDYIFNMYVWYVNTCSSHFERLVLFYVFMPFTVETEGDGSSQAKAGTVSVASVTDVVPLIFLSC